jgi:hypothetical protein
VVHTNQAVASKPANCASKRRSRRDCAGWIKSLDGPGDKRDTRLCIYPTPAAMLGFHFSFCPKGLYGIK